MGTGAGGEVALLGGGWPRFLGGEEEVGETAGEIAGAGEEEAGTRSTGGQAPPSGGGVGTMGAPELPSPPDTGEDDSEGVGEVVLADGSTEVEGGTASLPVDADGALVKVRGAADGETANPGPDEAIEGESAWSTYDGGKTIPYEG